MYVQYRHLYVFRIQIIRYIIINSTSDHYKKNCNLKKSFISSQFLKNFNQHVVFKHLNFYSNVTLYSSKTLRN